MELNPFSPPAQPDLTLFCHDIGLNNVGEYPEMGGLGSVHRFILLLWDLAIIYPCGFGLPRLGEAGRPLRRS